MEIMKQTDEIRVDTEEQAEALINQFKDESLTKGYDIANYSITLKEKKSKGEVIEEYYIVKITKRW